MSEIVVDTSVWIEYFKGVDYPTLDKALKDGNVLLPPIVLAELLCANQKSIQKKEFLSFLEELKFVNCNFDHWARVGEFRFFFAKKGITISTPDAHIAQTCIDGGHALMSNDKIFLQIAKVIKLNLIKSK